MSRHTRQWGGALPAAIILQLILLLVGLQIALAAAVARRGVARSGAQVQAERLAQTALTLAADMESGRLATALQNDGRVAVDVGPLPADRPLRVQVLDDDDGDGDPRVDINGRLLLHAVAQVMPPAARFPSRAELTREALVGAWLPLPAALVDCTDGLVLCAGNEGCPLPDDQVDGGEQPALAVPASGEAALRLKLFVLTRELLRRTLARCADDAACSMEELDFLQAAATEMIRRVEDPAGDALTLSREQVALMVSGLLALAGTETGPGSTPWWDGGSRTLEERQALVDGVLALMNPAGHLPDLSEHPYPQVFSGARAWRVTSGYCRRLPALLQTVLEKAAAGVEESAVTLVPELFQIASGETVRGEGLLVIRGEVQVAAGGRLIWRGSVVLSGGALTGPGQMIVDGSLIVVAGGPVPAVDLKMTVVTLRRQADLHGDAWKSAGTVLLSSWPGPLEPW